MAYTDWNILSPLYNWITSPTHHETRAIEGLASPGFVIETKESALATRIAPWFLFNATGAAVIKFRKVDASNYYELTLARSGVNLISVILNRVEAGTPTVLFNAAVTFDTSTWVKIILDNIYRCNNENVFIKLSFLNDAAAATEVFTIEDGDYLPGMVDAAPVYVQVMDNLIIDGLFKIQKLYLVE